MFILNLHHTEVKYIFKGFLGKPRGGIPPQSCESFMERDETEFIMMREKIFC